jgi:hypothetical protein
MLTLYLFESNWWDMFYEIYVLKIINKLILIKIAKKWENLLFYLLFIYFSNLGKYKPK